MDGVIQRINLYPMNSVIGLPNIYQLDRDLSGGNRHPPFEQLVPDFDFRIRLLSPIDLLD